MEFETNLLHETGGVARRMSAPIHGWGKYPCMKNIHGWGATTIHGVFEEEGGECGENGNSGEKTKIFGAQMNMGFT